MGSHFRKPNAEPAAQTPLASSQPQQAPQGTGSLPQQAAPQTQTYQSATTNPSSTGTATGMSRIAQMNIPSPADPATPQQAAPQVESFQNPVVTPDQALEVQAVDQALQDPSFTTVFSPLDLEGQTPGEQAREAGVQPVISIRNLTKVYPAQPNKPALEDITLDIYPGEFVFLVGHSGSGKTTLLRSLMREVKPTSGSITVAGQNLMKIKNRKIPYLRRQMGIVFQDFKLLPNKTVAENVAFALECIGKPRGVIRSQVPEVLRLVGLGEKLNAMPDQLSGGEQQRVSVARAMVNRPPLLICDEPTGNLDPAISLGIMKLLERINRTGTTVVVATHDREMVDSMHRRVIALEAGHVVRDQERGGYGFYDAL